MAKGDVQQSPWTWASGDYLGRQITASVTFDNTTRALNIATVHRDTGCLWHTMVFGLPSAATSKRLAAPADGQPDATYSAAQMASQGLLVIEDILALQITAEA